MGLELGALLAVTILGASAFSVFEVETPGWRKALKWSLLAGLTLALHAVVGHWSLLLPLGAGAAGALFHVLWCRRHGIHPVHATPRRRYYELRGWRWPE